MEERSKIRNSVIAIFITLGIGLFVGARITNHYSDKRLFELASKLREAQKIQETHQFKADSLSQIVSELEYVSNRHDSTIVILKRVIAMQKAVIKDYEEEVNKMTTSEKLDWILDRYSPDTLK